jgi:hypothetical protein
MEVFRKSNQKSLVLMGKLREKRKEGTKEILKEKIREDQKNFGRKIRGDQKNFYSIY